MKILILSPLKRKIVPSVTASRPRVVFELIQGLIKKGHSVNVLGTGDSQIPGATIIPIIPKSFVDLPAFENPFYAETSYLVQLAKRIEDLASQFDIIHNHTYPEFINLLVADKIKTPMVTTIHAQATKELDEVLSLFPKTTLVGLSKAHKNLFKKARISEVVYNGVDIDFYVPKEGKRDYLLWLGRLSKAKDKDGNFMDQKGIKWAIKLAQEIGEKLLLSGNVEDMAFFNQEVKPFLSEKIQWVGEVSSELPLAKQEVVKLMQGARAFLMTINWEEPFGLVMAESMSCGTPVIGFAKGSVPEIVLDGKTGFVVSPEEGLQGLKKALSRLNIISARACREHVIKNFSRDHMVENYENLYYKVMESGAV